MKKLKLNSKKEYQIAFWSSLIVSICLIIGGFFTPPISEIPGSLLTAVGLIFLYPSLAFANKVIEEGHSAKIVHGETTIEVGGEDK